MTLFPIARIEEMEHLIGYRLIDNASFEIKEYTIKELIAGIQNNSLSVMGLRVSIYERNKRLVMGSNAFVASKFNIITKNGYWCNQKNPRYTLIEWFITKNVTYYNLVDWEGKMTAVDYSILRNLAKDNFVAGIIYGKKTDRVTIAKEIPLNNYDKKYTLKDSADNSYDDMFID
jgi:hypothetical protein